jgi:RND family efflux transporter MFP subunit
MKRSIKWGVAALVLLLVAGGIGRTVVARKSAQTQAASAEKAVPALELAAADLVLAVPRELSSALEITGAIKAVNSAVVKAKVAAELQVLTVREGDRVSAGQVLGRLDATEFAWKVRQSQEQAAQAKAQLDIAERALENNRALVDQGFISKNALDTSVSNAAAARASLQAGRAATELAMKSQNDTVLRAPIAGIVSQRMAQPGERVAIDAKLIEIVDLSRLEIEAALAPEDVGAVKLGAVAKLAVDGLGEPVTAKVVRINPSTQAGTRAVLVYLSVEPREGLRQGLFAKGRIELERHMALSVPESAVRIDQARPYVLVLADSHVLRRTVELAKRGSVADARESYVEIKSGLQAGDQVLRATVGTVTDGTLARVAGPASTGAAAAASAGAATAAR